jgi:hypothetical protein
MAFGPKHFNLTIKLGTVFCFQGQDTSALLGGPESEPYLWVIGFKLDGTTLRQQGNFLTGTPGFFFSAGSHRNLTHGIVSRQSVRVRPEVGEWNTDLSDIPISVAGQQLTKIPGVIGFAAVLLEENLTPDDAAEAGHQSLNNLVKTTLQSILGSMGLAGIAADAVAAVAAAGGPAALSLETAAAQVVQQRLKPIQDLFGLAATAATAIAVLQNLGVDGFLGTAIDSDKPMGMFAKIFTQGQLAATSDERREELHEHLWSMPNWAYTIHGDVWAHHRFVRVAPPAARRLEVKCSGKRMLLDGPRISTIGGVSDGAAWQFGRQEAADLINRGEKEFFTRTPDGTEVKVFALQGGFVNGRPWHYLQTSADQHAENNLKDLPNCGSAGLYVEDWY